MSEMESRRACRELDEHARRLADEIREEGSTGWGAARDMMSPQLRRRLEEDEAEQASEAARMRRSREQSAEQMQEAAVHDALRQAVEAGEQVTPRLLRGEGLGHTPAEFIELASARADLDDARQLAVEAAAFRRWQAEHSPTGDEDALTARIRTLVQDEVARTLQGLGRGHTPSEFVAEVSARQDAQDEQAAAMEAAEWRRWQEEHGARPAEAVLGEVREASERTLMHERAGRFRARTQPERAARRLAREEAVDVVEAYRREGLVTGE